MGIFLIGALGLAIDGGQMYAQRQMAQAAADAAAQAGIMSIFNGTNATSAYPFGTGTTTNSFFRLHHDGPSNALRLCAEQWVRRNGRGHRDAKFSGHRFRRHSFVRDSSGI